MRTMATIWTMQMMRMKMNILQRWRAGGVTWENISQSHWGLKNCSWSLWFLFNWSKEWSSCWQLRRYELVSKIAPGPSGVSSNGALGLNCTPKGIPMVDQWWQWWWSWSTKYADVRWQYSVKVNNSLMLMKDWQWQLWCQTLSVVDKICGSFQLSYLLNTSSRSVTRWVGAS